MIYVSFLAHVEIASLIVSYRSLILMVALLSGFFLLTTFLFASLCVTCIVLSFRELQSQLLDE